MLQQQNVKNILLSTFVAFDLFSNSSILVKLLNAFARLVFKHQASQTGRNSLKHQQI